MPIGTALKSIQFQQILLLPPSVSIASGRNSKFMVSPLLSSTPAIFFSPRRHVRPQRKQRKQPHCPRSASMAPAAFRPRPSHPPLALHRPPPPHRPPRRCTQQMPNRHLAGVRAAAMPTAASTSRSDRLWYWATHRSVAHASTTPTRCR